LAQLHCPNCGGNHSAAFKECPEYRKAQEILEIRSKHKLLSYADAVKKLSEIKRSIVEPCHPRVIRQNSDVSERRTNIYPPQPMNPGLQPKADP